ncbi:MAG: hypothetical protein J5616_06560 [Bacteroidaceae bacterium]|nr:hypothetical protein [Bacteroidaceae bacterium]
MKKNATLYVPTGLANKYTSVSGWKDFAHIVEYDIDETAINLPKATTETSDDCYTLEGRKLSGKPTQSGFYINKGKKVYVK